MGDWVQIEPTGRQAYLAMPEGKTGPGVLVLHAWWGLTHVFTDVCDRLAANGYVALAPELYADGATTDSIAEAEQMVSRNERSPEETEAVVLASVDHLLALPAVNGARIGVIGFSMGAYWALDLSRMRPDGVSAVVAVYGTCDGEFHAARAAYLGHFAEHDDYEPLEAVRALEASLRAAGRDVEFHIYPGTGHWFVEPNRPDVYNQEAAELVWERTLAFFGARLGQAE